MACHMHINSRLASVHPERGKDVSTERPAHATELSLSSTHTSATAAAARSITLYLGMLFRRPSKLFRPSRVDTLGALRHLAISADQTLSPSFIRSLLSSRRGVAAIIFTLLPPLVVNTSLGFLLFTSHSFFSLVLAKLPYFHGTERVNMHNLLAGPSAVPDHPTLLSGIAGAGAGIVQGFAFTPVENMVRILQSSANSLSAATIRIFRLPFKPPPVNDTRITWKYWSGLQWTVGRDAASYACFFAAFDASRRLGLYVRDSTDNRMAQAATLVAGGISASLAAELVGRPLRRAQYLSEHGQAIHYRHLFTKPVTGTFLQRTAWRMAAVGPWGLGFLAWAWASDEL